MKFTTIHKPASLALYLLSLGMPGFYRSYASLFENPGGFLLAFGWLAVFAGQVAWFANPLFLLSFLRISAKASAQLASWALALSLAFLVYPRTVEVRGAPEVKEIGAFGLGYALWVSAIAVMAIGQFRMSRGADRVAAARPALGVAGGILILYLVYFFLVPFQELFARG